MTHFNYRSDDAHNSLMHAQDSSERAIVPPHCEEDLLDLVTMRQWTLLAAIPMQHLSEQQASTALCTITQGNTQAASGATTEGTGGGGGTTARAVINGNRNEDWISPT